MQSLPHQFSWWDERSTEEGRGKKKTRHWWSPLEAAKETSKIITTLLHLPNNRADPLTSPGGASQAKIWWGEEREVFETRFENYLRRRKKTRCRPSLHGQGESARWPLARHVTTDPTSIRMLVRFICYMTILTVKYDDVAIE